MGRGGRDAAKIYGGNPERIGSPEHRTRVVLAADIIEYQDDRDLL